MSSNREPGLGTKYIADHYSGLPSQFSNLRNGHVLQICILKSSLTPATKLIMDTYPETHVAGHRMIYRLLNKLKQKMEVYKKRISKEIDQFTRFKSFLEDSFNIPVSTPKKDSTSLSVTDNRISDLISIQSDRDDLSMPSPEPSTSYAMPQCATVSDETTQQTLNMSTSRLQDSLRNQNKCEGCKDLRNRLHEVLREKSEARIRYNQNTKLLKQQFNEPVKVISQKFKRKVKQYDNLKQKTKTTFHSMQIADLKKKLSNLTKAHNKLKKYHDTNKDSLKIKKDKQLMEKIKILQSNLEESNERYRILEDKCTTQDDEIVELKNNQVINIKDGKTFSSKARQLVYDCIVNQVPSKNVHDVFAQFFCRLGLLKQIYPSRSAVENMTRELGVISELQAAQVILQNKNNTLGFDATTQEGVHINSIHITTETQCIVLAVDQLPGGTAHDYQEHISDTIDNLAEVHSYFNKSSFEECKAKLINNISNTMTDRCAANHAAIRLLNEEWDKSLNELNCHLHPLDSFSTSVRSSLAKLESSQKISSQLYGSDCVAGKIVLQMNKLRYKDGKGDPRGFKIFLENENLKLGIVPRYRGNRLHVLFHIGGVYIQHYDLFLKYLKTGTSLNGFRAKIFHDMTSLAGKLEMQVLGLFGKLLTGPWMKTFYTSDGNQIPHLDGINLVRKIIETLQEQKQDPMRVLARTTDFFGNTLDNSVQVLQNTPRDTTLFIKW